MKTSVRLKLCLPGPAVILTLACFFLLLPSPLRAEEGAGAAHPAMIRHDLALFVGVTEDRGEDEFTLGLEYEYRILSWFGAGGLVDFVFGEVRARLTCLAAYFRPTHRLKLSLAPGVEHFANTARDKGETAFALRVGAAYDFEITERFYLAPTLSLDFVDGETLWIGGLDFGFKLGEPR